MPCTSVRRETLRLFAACRFVGHCRFLHHQVCCDTLPVSFVVRAHEPVTVHTLMRAAAPCSIACRLSPDAGPRSAGSRCATGRALMRMMVSRHQAEIGIAPGSFEPALDEGAEPPAKPHRIASDRQPRALVALERGCDRCRCRRGIGRARGVLAGLEHADADVRPRHERGVADERDAVEADARRFDVVDRLHHVPRRSAAPPRRTAAAAAPRHCA